MEGVGLLLGPHLSHVEIHVYATGCDPGVKIRGIGWASPLCCGQNPAPLLKPWETTVCWQPVQAFVGGAKWISSIQSR